MGNMGEVATLTDRLAMMPDNMLPRLAQQYKGDAITLSLILGEKNRRDRVRNAAKAQAAGQPMPKVNDEVVASMQPQQLPEQVGIGTLPAPNMERMADGGITGYDEMDFAQHSEPVVRMADGGVPRYADQGLVRNPLAFLNPSDLFGGVGRIFSEGIDPVAAEQRRQAALRRLVTPAEETVGTPEFAAAQEALRAKAKAEGRVLPGDAPTGGLGDLVKDKEKPVAQAQPAAPAAPSGSSALESIYKRLQGPADKELATLRSEREKYAEGLTDYAKKELESYDADEAKKGDVFKAREERLAKREDEISKLKGSNEGLALLAAGAAIMSTPGSLATALGRGLNVGVERYAAGAEKITAAQERLLDAKDKLDELRLNREDMSAKERRTLTSQINRAELEGKKLFLDGAEKDFGYKREDAKTMFAGITQLMGSETAAGATIQAAKIRSQDQKEYLAELRGGSMVETARKNIMAEIIKANPYADEPTRQRLFDAKWQEALQSNPALAKYAGVSGGGGAPSADPLGILGK